MYTFYLISFKQETPSSTAIGWQVKKERVNFQILPY